MKPINIYWQGEIHKETIPASSKLEAYNRTSIFIPVDITYDVVE